MRQSHRCDADLARSPTDPHLRRGDRALRSRRAAPRKSRSSTRSFLILVTIQLLIVWRLLHRFLIAWSLVVLVSGLYAVSFVLVGAPYETTFTASCLLTLMQVGLLFTPPVLAYVFSEQDGAASPRKGG